MSSVGREMVVMYVWSFPCSLQCTRVQPFLSVQDAHWNMEQRTMSLVSQRHQRREHSGLITAAHLRTRHSRKKWSCRSAQAQAPVRSLNSFLWLFSSWSKVIQQNQHRYQKSTANDGTALNWCPPDLFVIFKVLYLPVITYLNLVSLGKKCRR